MIGFHYKHTPHIASYRYRCEIPMIHLARMGEKVGLGAGEVTIFAKHFDPKDLDVATRLKKDGKRVIYDVCDDHFNNEYGPHYRGMCAIADVIVCPTDHMADRVLEETGKEAVVIPDPYEFPCMLPSMPNKGLNVLWYGMDVEELKSALPISGNLLAVTLEGKGHVIWTKENMLHAYAWADVVILPGATKPTRSANRMVEAIRQGKFVIADNSVAAYRGYGMFLGPVEHGLEWVRSNVEEALERVDKAQLVVERLHNPRRIAGFWRDVIYGDHNACGTEDGSQVLAEQGDGA